MAEETLISSPDELRGWLKGRSAENARFIAIRSALRTLPLIAASEGKFDGGKRERFWLDYFRAAFTLSLFISFPDKEIQIAAARLPKWYYLSDRERNAYRYVGAAAARAIETITASATALAIEHATKSAALAVQAIGAADGTSNSAVAVAQTSLWLAISNDAARIADVSDARYLVELPLWNGGIQCPALIENAWKALTSDSQFIALDFTFWEKWYNLLISPTNRSDENKAVNMDLFRRIALSSDEWWNRRAWKIHADIKELFNDYELKNKLNAIKPEISQSETQKTRQHTLQEGNNRVLTRLAAVAMPEIGGRQKRIERTDAEKKWVDAVAEIEKLITRRTQ